MGDTAPGGVGLTGPITDTGRPVRGWVSTCGDTEWPEDRGRSTGPTPRPPSLRRECRSSAPKPARKVRALSIWCGPTPPLEIVRPGDAGRFRSRHLQTDSTGIPDYRVSLPLSPMPLRPRSRTAHTGRSEPGSTLSVDRPLTDCDPTPPPHSLRSWLAAETGASRLRPEQRLRP